MVGGGTRSAASVATGPIFTRRNSEDVAVATVYLHKKPQVGISLNPCRARPPPFSQKHGARQVLLSPALHAKPGLSPKANSSIQHSDGWMTPRRRFQPPVRAASRRVALPSHHLVVACEDDAVEPAVDRADIRRGELRKLVHAGHARNVFPLFSPTTASSQQRRRTEEEGSNKLFRRLRDGREGAITSHTGAQRFPLFRPHGSFVLHTSCCVRFGCSWPRISTLSYVAGTEPATQAFSTLYSPYAGLKTISTHQVPPNDRQSIPRPADGLLRMLSSTVTHVR